jgi:hypothetical protein
MSQIPVNPFQKPVSNNLLNTHLSQTQTNETKILENEASDDEEVSFFHKMKKPQEKPAKNEDESMPKDPRNRMRKK